MGTLLERAEAISTVAVAGAGSRWSWVVPAVAILTAVALMALVAALVVSAATDPMAGT